MTAAAGLDVPIASHSAAWADFDNDGHLDLFVCGEYANASSDNLFNSTSVMVADTRNLCRLYRNKGDGTFVNVAEQAGVRNYRFAKAAVCIDYDGDRLPDIYVSNCGQENRLFHNRGNWTFEDLAAKLDVTDPRVSFTCGVLDFDNDGRPDIFVSDYTGGLNVWATSVMNLPSKVVSHPRLFKNMGVSGFKDVSREVGLDKVTLAMGMGVGDIDNDGFLDLYLGTGLPGYSALMPNILYKNCAGQRFEDITESSGTGHLQKGHGSSFADWDCDGDLDLFVEVGGAVPGDKAYNLFFSEPRSRPALAQSQARGNSDQPRRVGGDDPARREASRCQRLAQSIVRSATASSYGGSTLVETIGLDNATSIATLTVSWPVSRTTQTFHNLTPDTAVEVTEGSDVFQVLNLPPLPAPPKTQHVAEYPRYPDLPGPVDSDHNKSHDHLAQISFAARLPACLSSLVILDLRSSSVSSHKDFFGYPSATVDQSGEQVANVPVQTDNTHIPVSTGRHREPDKPRP